MLAVVMNKKYMSKWAKWVNLLYPDTTALNKRCWELCKLWLNFLCLKTLLSTILHPLEWDVRVCRDTLFSGVLWCEGFTGESKKSYFRELLTVFISCSAVLKVAVNLLHLKDICHLLWTCFLLMQIGKTLIHILFWIMYKII